MFLSLGVPRPTHIQSFGAASHTWGHVCLPSPLSSFKGRDCLYLCIPPPLYPVLCPLGHSVDGVRADGSRSPRKPIDSLRDSRSLSYSPVERCRPSPQPSPRDQQSSSSERGSRRGQRGDSRSPGHKRRRGTPSPQPIRHRSSRSP
ncbi:serine/arginine repetitive matrix protein 2 isoform X3 [Otolemur garnettii]|uniref:serine/arginine repetitive matrix protein 2 isoform X3 n=1 Tax=Otolemur garnettii TaxID=30611 RepID=UPI000644630C|nr:serine/arginine repetitive matrix protein 2 isoform X3 [Otolemur garnettii]XP_012661202.1 serine/arginine repetitive matrix protein 2 isoform X3 [Otolemur garnettii]